MGFRGSCSASPSLGSESLRSTPHPNPLPGGARGLTVLFLELHRLEISSRTQVMNSTKICSLSPFPREVSPSLGSESLRSTPHPNPLPRGARGLTVLFLELHRPEISSRTQVLKSMEICSLSLLPSGERAGVRGGSSGQGRFKFKQRTIAKRAQAPRREPPDP